MRSASTPACSCNAAFAVVRHQFERNGDEPERLSRGGQRRGALGGAQEVGAGGIAQAGGIRIVRQEPVGVDAVGGDHLGQFVAAEPGKVVGRRQVQALALAPAEGVARNRPHHVLHKAVLAAFRRARVGLDRDELLARQRREHLLDLIAGHSADRRKAVERERLAEHRRLLHEPALVLGKTVEPGGDEGVQRLGDLELRDRAGDPIAAVAGAHDDAAVEQHPRRLDRVQRHTLSRRRDACDRVRRQSRHHSRDELRHGLSAERLERERCERPRRRPPARTIAELWPRERDHEQAVIARPLHQVGDEREQRLVGPLHVLEDEHDGQALGHRLEEPAPGREEAFAVAVGDLRQPQQMAQRRHHPVAVLRVGHPFAHHGLELGPGCGGRLVLGDPGAHAHHLAQCPECDPVAVGQAAAAVPEHLVGEAVRVLLELPRQARLADAGDAGDVDEMRAPALGRVEQVLQQAQLALPADERWVESRAAADPAPGGRDAHGPPERHGLGLALERKRPGGLADDRRLGHPPGRLVDEHGSGRRRSLDAGRGVDEISGHDALADRAHRHGGLARGDARAGLELETVTVAEGAHGVDELERDPDGPLGIVLLGDGGSPDGHDRVADELLDRAAMALDGHAGGVEVAGQKLAHLLRVA